MAGERDPKPKGVGFYYLDHLTHNVGRQHGHLVRVLFRKPSIREIRFFSIEGKLTGLHSRALTSPCARSASDQRERRRQEPDRGVSEAYKGEGIQHIAVGTNDIYAASDAIAANGLAFMPGPPDAYYKSSFKRVPGHTEPIHRMKQHGILIDGEGVVNGGTTRVLLQIFSKTVIGPIFFEFIQRKGDDGFGEGNFRALFESIEADQIERGVLTA